MDPFATLGLARRYDVDPVELESRYRALQRALHPDRHASESASARRMNLARAVEVNEAYRVLKDDLARAEALLELYGVPGSDSAADPAFLMQMMELRESLAAARTDPAAVAKLAAGVERHRAEAAAALRDAFAEIAGGGEASVSLRDLVGRLRYYRRFMDEVTLIEEEALG